jgi:hypothetical protein
MELPISQQDVQQPVLKVRGLRPGMVQQEILIRLFTKNKVFDAELVVVQLDLLDAC